MEARRDRILCYATIFSIHYFLCNIQNACSELLVVDTLLCKSMIPHLISWGASGTQIWIEGRRRGDRRAIIVRGRGDRPQMKMDFGDAGGLLDRVHGRYGGGGSRGEL